MLSKRGEDLKLAVHINKIPKHIHIYILEVWFGCVISVGYYMPSFFQQVMHIIMYL